jgi:hypothetical protein
MRTLPHSAPVYSQEMNSHSSQFDTGNAPTSSGLAKKVEVVSKVGGPTTIVKTNASAEITEQLPVRQTVPVHAAASAAADGIASSTALSKRESKESRPQTAKLLGQGQITTGSTNSDQMVIEDAVAPSSRKGDDLRFRLAEVPPNMSAAPKPIEPAPLPAAAVYTSKKGACEAVTEKSGSKVVSEKLGSEAVSGKHGSEAVSEKRGCEKVTERRGSEAVSEKHGSEAVCEKREEMVSEKRESEATGAPKDNEEVSPRQKPSQGLKVSKKRRIEEYDSDSNYPQVLTQDGWLKVRTSDDKHRFKLELHNTVKSESPQSNDESEEVVLPEPCETIERPLLRNHSSARTSDRNVSSGSGGSSGSSYSGRASGFKRFRKNDIRRANQREVVLAARMDKVFPKESEREIQVKEFFSSAVGYDLVVSAKTRLLRHRLS